MNYRDNKPILNKSNIEWTEITWNPTTGCSKVSSGCKNCYAERWAKMQHKRGIYQYRNGFELTLSPNRLKDPLKWKKPQVVFVNSMSDLFHERIPDDYIMQVFDMMSQVPKHQFQILTKRIDRTLTLAPKLLWSSNIWLGVSVESEDYIYRIGLLKKIPAKIKFISFEPLLSEIGFSEFRDIDWVLVGGESGSKARPVKKEWVLSIKDKCDRFNIPFFFKQWGRREFNPDARDPTINKKHPNHAKGGCQIDNLICRKFPE